MGKDAQKVRIQKGNREKSRKNFFCYKIGE
nr:MAG TPA: hypothetical protein [Caudoviricetes sp.]